MSTYALLKQLVVSGAIAAEAKASESQLAARLGVSRTPIREALQRLESEGLVVAQGRGVRVRIMDAAEMAAVLTARAGLESWAIGLAARRVAEGMIAPAALTELERLADETDRLTRSGDLVNGAEANRRFHRRMAELCDNPTIVETLDQWWDRVTVSTRHTLRTHERVGEVHREHRRILEALTRGLPREARDAVETHVLATRDTLLALDQRGTHAHP